MHVMEIETALTNRDDARRLREIAHLRDASVVAVFRVMRMYADRGIDVRIALGDGDGLAIAFDRAEGTNRDHQAQSGFTGACEDGVKIAAQLGVCKMTMCVG